jgi:hypothetical protein
MQILALLHARAGATASEFMPLRVAEETALWPLWQTGVVRQMWFRQDSPQPVFLLEAADIAAARLALAALPMVQAQLFTVELVALRNFDAMQVLFSQPN